MEVTKVEKKYITVIIIIFLLVFFPVAIHQIDIPPRYAGHDNAQYLMEQEQNWMTEYSRAVFVDWDLPGSDGYKEFTRECAQFMNWDYDEIKGNPALMQRLLDGDWNEAEFLTIKPGSRIAEDLTEPGIIKAE